MNTDLRKAAERVLEDLIKIQYALESSRVWGGMDWAYHPIHPFKYLPLRDKAEEQIEALRQALEQPEQEPVGYVTNSGTSAWILKDVDLDDDTPIYTAPPSIEAAVLEEREACAKVCDEQGMGSKALEHYAALTYSGATHDCAAAIRARSKK